MIIEKKNWKAITKYVNRLEKILHFNQRIKIRPADRLADDFVIHKVKFNKYDIYKASDNNCNIFTLPYGRNLSEEFVINMITEVKLNNECLILDEDNNIDEELSAPIESEKMEESSRNWLTELAKKVKIIKLNVEIKGRDGAKTVYTKENIDFYHLYQQPSFENSSSTNWCEFLMFDKTKAPEQKYED